MGCLFTVLLIAYSTDRLAWSISDTAWTLSVAVLVHFCLNISKQK
jgi:hypothetical protein